jgi:RNA polymerase sigma factor (sigma-70 family)
MNRLTETERKIAELIQKEELTNREISQRLGMAEGTVRTHISKIFIKLQIKSREELKSKE